MVGAEKPLSTAVIPFLLAWALLVTSFGRSKSASHKGVRHSNRRYPMATIDLELVEEDRVKQERELKTPKRKKIVIVRKRHRPPIADLPEVSQIPIMEGAWSSFGDDLLIADPDMDYDIYFELMCPDYKLG